MPYGLAEKDIEQIIQAADKFNDTEAIILFGSRGKGNYKPGSDVDLAIKGAPRSGSLRDRLREQTIAQLADSLNEETTMPYFFDVVDYGSLDKSQLIAHIDRRGIVIFKDSRESSS